MSDGPSRWRAAALGVALAVVLAGPVSMLRVALRPEPFDAQHLRVSFESVRYERAGLVFTYLLQNRTRRSARLLPTLTRLRAMQDAGPVVGYPVMHLPLEIEAHESRKVEVRLELAMPNERMTPRQSADQTASVLQHKLPDPAVVDSPLAPLPMTKLPEPPEPPKVQSADTLLVDA